MGVLDRFEKGVERAFSNTFARAFKADLKPVDIASALRIEMDDRIASLSRGRTVVPNVFVVEVGPADLAKVQEWGEEEFTDELVRAVTTHATDQGYVFVGPVNITFESFEEFKAGQFTIRSSSQTPEAAQAHPDSPERSVPAPAPIQEAPPAPSSTPGYGSPILDVDGQRYLLTGPVTVLGRGSEADIVVSDTGVSRRHLEIAVTPDGVIATDLGSTNGSYVEGHRISAATLVDGNSLSIGRTKITYWEGSSHSSGGQV